MDIGSKNGYPSAALSNFAPHRFIIDGVECKSMEGFLQSLKFSNPAMQEEVCKLVGLAAKRRGSQKHWQQDQTLYWKGQPIKRDSQEYQALLDRAYDALYCNPGFQAALLACGKQATFTHSIGKIKQNETVLTRAEFCSRITKLHARIYQEREAV